MVIAAVSNVFLESGGRVYPICNGASERLPLNSPTAYRKLGISPLYQSYRISTLLMCCNKQTIPNCMIKKRYNKKRDFFFFFSPFSYFYVGRIYF